MGTPTRYTRTCVLCGMQFVTNQPAAKLCQKPHPMDCPVCGKEFTVTERRPNQCCSPKCSGILRKQRAEATSLLKYGVGNAGYTAESQAKIRATTMAHFGVEYVGQAEEQKAKGRATCMKRFGVPNANQSPEIRAKTQATCLERYGDTCVLGKNSSLRPAIIQACIDKYGTPDPGNRPEALEKRKKTNLTKFGVEFPMQDPEFQERVRLNNRKKYGVDYPMQSPEVKARLKQRFIELWGVDSPMKVPEIVQHLSDVMMEKYGVPWACMTPNCIDAVGTRISTFNQAFGAQLEAAGFNVEYEFGVGRYQYDIKVGNILIEIDPTYTHTTYTGVHSRFGSVTADYHLKKTTCAEEHGYRCIHVFEWDAFDDILALLTARDDISPLLGTAPVQICDRSKFSPAQFETLGYRAVETYPPVEHWVKDCQRLDDTPDDVDELLKSGWLPICDCGYMVFEKG